MSRWIVCGVRGGGDACTTLTVARRLAERLGARLAIVTVESAPDEREAMSERLAAARARVAEVARSCAVADDAVHCAELGEPVEALTATADDLDAALLVVGAARRSALASLVAPTVPARLIERAGRPVVVVPEGGSDAFRRGIGLGGSVVAGIDGGDDDRLAGYTVTLAQELGIRPVLVTATSAESAEERLSVAASAADVNPERIARAGDPARTLEQVARDQTACAIVVASRGRGRFLRALRGSVTAGLARRATRPVVVLPPDERAAAQQP